MPAVTWTQRAEDLEPERVAVRPDVEWTLRDEIQASESRLQRFCDLVNAGQAQGGAREFRRQIDAMFATIKEHPEYNRLRSGN